MKLGPVTANSLDRTKAKPAIGLLGQLGILCTCMAPKCQKRTRMLWETKHGPVIACTPEHREAYVNRYVKCK